MRNRKWLVLVASLAVGVCWLASPQSLAAQQATVGVPLINSGNSFYENYGVNWGFRGHNFFFNNGGGGAIPPFGGFDPNAGLHTGFQTAGRGGGFFFDFTAGQGSNSTITSSTPMITLQNGVPGAIWDTSLRPFVIGVVPVVGGNVQLSSPLMERLSRIKAGEVPAQTPGAYVRAIKPRPEERLAVAPVEELRDVRGQDGRAAEGTSSAGGSTSSAGRGDLSVADIRRAAAQEDTAKQREIDALIEQARGQEELGKMGVAKIYYQQAARRATGDQQRQLLQKIRELSGASSSAARSTDTSR